jgi:hypothetical protein
MGFLRESEHLIKGSHSFAEGDSSENQAVLSEIAVLASNAERANIIPPYWEQAVFDHLESARTKMASEL